MALEGWLSLQRLRAVGDKVSHANWMSWSGQHFLLDFKVSPAAADSAAAPSRLSHSDAPPMHTSSPLSHPAHTSVSCQTLFRRNRRVPSTSRASERRTVTQGPAFHHAALPIERQRETKATPCSKHLYEFLHNRSQAKRRQISDVLILRTRPYQFAGFGFRKAPNPAFGSPMTATSAYAPRPHSRLLFGRRAPLLEFRHPFDLASTGRDPVFHLQPCSRFPGISVRPCFSPLLTWSSFARSLDLNLSHFASPI